MFSDFMDTDWTAEFPTRCSLCPVPFARPHGHRISAKNYDLLLLYCSLKFDIGWISCSILVNMFQPKVIFLYCENLTGISTLHDKNGEPRLSVQHLLTPLCLSVVRERGVKKLCTWFAVKDRGTAAWLWPKDLTRWCCALIERRLKELWVIQLFMFPIIRCVSTLALCKTL